MSFAWVSWLSGRAYTETSNGLIYRDGLNTLVNHLSFKQEIQKRNKSG